MPRSILAGVVVPWAGLSVVSHASACPDCPTARLVTQALCASDLGLNIAITLAPFVVFALVAAVVHRLGRNTAVARR